MSVIRILPQIVINKIAAGEVVERPASVIKELLENSLDANATRIDVEIEEGGRKLIRVTDNGQGMDADDVSLALESHATSKLRDSSDLFFITTMGFRGEALPSIAAVSQMRLLSRPKGSQGGYEITVSGGKKSEVKAQGAAEGTMVEVRNLFFNVPARRKFLKSIPTETSHIVDAITHIALARPDVHFTLKRNQKEIVNAPSTEDRGERVGHFFGADLAEVLVSVDGGDGPIRVTGYVAPPSESRGNAKLQKIFLNRRLVHEKSLTRALMNAYTGLLPPGRFPPAFLFIQMDPREVDVNVSPTKLHVRFRNSQQVFVAVQSAVSKALSSHDIQPHIPVPGTESMRSVRSPESAKSVSTFSLPFSWREPASFPTPSAKRPSDTTAEREVRCSRSEVPRPTSPDRFVQVHDSYIVVERDGGLEIIDQHALHERILYEEMERRLSRAPLESQRLLVPEIIELSKQEIELLMSAVETARQLGIELAPFGDRSIAVHALPSLLSDENPAQLMRELLDELSSSGEVKVVDTLRNKLMQMIACKAAVKAGDALSDEEIASLLRKRNDTERPEACPHGRPTSLRLSLRELEKHFKRR